jgi:hypothetical protein
MSLGVSILKVLSSYPDGRASLASLQADLAMLTTREFTARMRALAADTGPINLFSSGLVLRDQTGWSITSAGLAFLNALEAGLAAPAMSETSERVVLRLVSSRDIPQATGTEAQSRPDDVRESFPKLLVS